MLKAPATTISVQQIDNVVNDDLCLGCGFCQISVDENGNTQATDARIEFNEARSTFLADSGTTSGIADDMGKPAASSIDRGVAEPRVVCPGRSMPLNSLHNTKYPPAKNYLGHYLHTAAAFNTNPEQRLTAASGGIASTMVRYYLQQGIAERAYMTQNIGVRNGSAGAYLSLAQINSSVNDSIYHPANFGAGLKQLIACNKPFVFVGLPCEIAALESLMQQSPALRQRCQLTVGLFCGGVNRLDGIEWYIHKMLPALRKPLKSIRYREGFWPGAIIADDGQQKATVPRIKGNSRRNIIKYIAAFQGFYMHKRCRICPDQVSYLADISVGDPHLAKFKDPKSAGISAVVIRSQRALHHYNAMAEQQLIGSQPLSAEDIIESQGYTLKNRAHSDIYVAMANKLGMAAPTIESLNIEHVDEQYKKRIAAYARLDLLKIKYRDNALFRQIMIPFQIVEYLFIRFTPKEFFRKLASLAKNKS